MKIIVDKPENWNDLVLHQKIKEYGKRLDSRFSKYVDKLEAKKVVNQILRGAVNTGEVLSTFTLDTFQSNYLQKKCLLKASHGSRWNLDLDLIDIRDYKTVIEYLKKWNIRYSDINPEEVQYSFLTPRFYIEKKVEDYRKGVTSNATTFLFHCIQGVPQVLQVLYEFTAGSYVTNRYFVHIKEAGIALELVSGDHPFELPDEAILKRMYDYSKLLSKRFEFVRIDFYYGKNGDIYFSEFTFTPNAGVQCYTNIIEESLGLLWNY